MTPSEIAHQGEQTVLLASAIEDLPADYRTVILLRHVQGLSHKEVAAKMQRSLDSVKKLWVRALVQFTKVDGVKLIMTQHARTENTEQPVSSVDDVRVIAEIDRYQNLSAEQRRMARTELAKKYPFIGNELKAALDALDLVEGLNFELTAVPTNAPRSRVGEIALCRSLGDFRLVREIGRGGMGIVYEAEQLSLGRRVALKVLPFASMLNSKQLQRFKNEAKAAATIQHPHIVPVYSIGCERGVHYYAMQYVEGRSLAEVIHDLRQQLPVDPSATSHGEYGNNHVFATEDQGIHARKISANTETDAIAALSTERSTNRDQFYRSVAQIGVQVAEALHYAHEMGVVHRDIKPSNLLIDAEGQMWVTDFGLAMTLTDPELTMTGDVLGTLRYMSPEQASGRNTVLDHRTEYLLAGRNAVRAHLTSRRIR